MKVKEEDVDAIFETIVASRDTATQAQLLISLQALAKVCLPVQCRAFY